MDQVTTLNRKRIIPVDQIPNQVYGVLLSEQEKERLSYGEWSSKLEHMTTQDGGVKDGKIKFHIGRDNQLHMNVIFEKERINLPTEYQGKKFTKEEVENFKQGKTVILNLDGDDMYFKLDNELNSLTFNTGKELAIPNQMPGYTLTNEDKVNLAMGKPMGTRLFEGEEKGTYFLANIQISPDRMNMIFKDIKTLEKGADIEALRAKYNSPPTLATATEKAAVLDQTPNNPELDKAITEKDYNKLQQLKEQGLKVTDKDIASIKSNGTLSREEKVAVLTTLGVGSEINKEEEQKEEFYKAVDQKDDSKIKELTNNGFKPEQKELDYIINHKGIQPDEKKDMLSHLNIAPDKQQESNIQIDKVEEKFKEEAKIAKEKDTPGLNNRKAERLVTNAFHDI